MRISDWSSDVCSSDLKADRRINRGQRLEFGFVGHVLRKQRQIEARFADILRPQIQIELIVRRDDAEGHNGIVGIEIAVASRLSRREADIADIRAPDEIADRKSPGLNSSH